MCSPPSFVNITTTPGYSFGLLWLLSSTDLCVHPGLDICLPLRLTPACLLDFDSIMSITSVRKDYGSWSVTDLKNELRKRNAKLAGKKATLVQRLEDYDKLFGPLVSDPESVYKIMVPGPQHFRDITSNSIMPALSTDDLDLFCQITERENLVTSRNMYEEYFLMSCRIATVDNNNYVTGMVASEMRKNILYNVTVKVKNHLILEAQCECAAGMGPYAQCKHVLVVILGIIDMHENKAIKIKSSITSNVQTFHQPNKLHSGDPFKAEDIKLKLNDDQYRKMATFDPRPVAISAESYSRDFKNKIANFCGQAKVTSTVTMPMAQLIRPADKSSIFRDHDYLEKTNEAAFLESMILTDQGILALEENTRQNKKLWRRERLTRIHSSNYGKILKSRLDGKKKLAKALLKDVDLATAAIKHGLKYEDKAVRQFELQTNLDTTKCGIIVNKEHQFLASTPDRLVGEACVLEVKCPYTARNQKICPENVPYLFLCDKTGLLKLDVNHDYYYQVQGQLMCTGRQMAFFCIYTISDCQVMVIERDNTFIQSMIENLKKFYDDFFIEAVLNKFLYNKK